MNKEQFPEGAEYYGGFHRCYLDTPIHLDYASESFCKMTGYTRGEFHDLFDDRLIEIVHPEDRAAFREYVKRLAAREQTLTLRYRILRKDGSVMTVDDTQTSKRMDDGHLYGFSVVTDITEYVTAETSAETLSLPYGVMRCSMDKYPRVLGANAQMDEFVGVTAGETAWSAFARDNVFFLLPFEEREMFRKYLDEARETKKPINIEHDIIRCDGSRIRMMGWVSAANDEYTFIYMRVSEQGRLLRENRYLRALKSAFNAIFELNLLKGTVECVFEAGTLLPKEAFGICMTVESAVSYWLDRFIVPEDREPAGAFFARVITPGALTETGEPLKTAFHIRCEAMTREVLCIAMELDKNTVLVCCREDGASEAEGSVSPRVARETAEVFIRTFGYFDVFAGGKTVRFSNNKEKELFALLVDRQGGCVTGENAISLLWEDAELTENTRTRYRKLAMGLKNTLERYGIGHILINERGVRHLDTQAVTCDLYEALAGNGRYKALFSGVYMQNYTWAEETLGMLLQTL